MSTETEMENRELMETSSENFPGKELASESEAVLIQEPLPGELMETSGEDSLAEQLTSDSQGVLMTEPLSEESMETAMDNALAEELASNSQAVLIQRPLPQLLPSKELPAQARVVAFLRDPVNNTVGFFQPYKPILVTIGLALLTVLGIRLLLSLLGAVFFVINSIPIFSPLIELVGLGYCVWFIYRYLLKASTREELAQKIGEIKKELIGDPG